MAQVKSNVFRYIMVYYNRQLRRAWNSEEHEPAGCPYDNVPMERYYNSLKAELIDRFYFHTDEQLDYAVAEYAYLWYNQIRPHSYNNYLTPLEARNSSD